MGRMGEKRNEERQILHVMAPTLFPPSNETAWRAIKYTKILQSSLGLQL